MRWFRKKPAAGSQPGTQAHEPGKYAPGTNIAYDPGLIDRFKGQHQVLSRLCSELSIAAQGHDFERVMEKLRRFAQMLEQHLLEENLRFYVYLGKCLGDGDDQEYVVSLQRDMKQIGREVRAFARRYIEQGVGAGNVAEFRKELHGASELLSDRLQTEEESLFDFYLQPDDYHALR